MLSDAMIHQHTLSFPDIELKASYINGVYKSSSFVINDISWMLKLEVVEGHGDEGATIGRSLFYQLQPKLNSFSEHNQISARFVAISGPINEANADIHHHLFKVMNRSDSDSSSDSDCDPPESPEYKLYLASTEECNKLLSSRTIRLRLIISFDIS